MKSPFKAIKTFIMGMGICVLSLSFLSSSGNNIRINGTVQVSQGTGDTLVLSFPLRWDNSWRDQFNWDAAWVFLKYKSGTGGWNHVNLCSGGHRFVNSSGQSVPFESMLGNTGSSTVGLFVYRSTLEAGNTPEIVCQVKCLKSALGGLTPEKFANHEGFVLAQAVETVYVPCGGYYLGDGECSNRFAGGSDGSPVLIGREEAITASTAIKVYPFTSNTIGAAQSIAAVYPKGYKGFYMMKYEVSQEQWVYFLNTLTYVQQQERVPGLTGLKSGEFIFGSKNAPSNRNGIIVAEPSYNSNPVIFANNLNNNETYSEDGDGKTIACNYLSPSDMLAYCSWSGLRPMSELEYEKACRPIYPEQSVRGEYAWHDNGILGRLNAVSNSGQRNERSGTANANVNAGNTFGPVRCGLFATGSSTQQSAGAAFWGGMELSGNLKELCYNLAYTGFNGATMGTGVYSTALWSVTPAHFGVKGGGFTSADSLLRVSDRTEISNYFADINKRDNTVGFRGVRGYSVDILPGDIRSFAEFLCPGISEVINVQAATSSVQGMDFLYIWYVKTPGSTQYERIEGESGENLLYEFINTGRTTVEYHMKRQALCPVGEAYSREITVKVVPNPFTELGEDIKIGTNQITNLWAAVPGQIWTLTGTSSGVTVDNSGVLQSSDYDYFMANVSLNTCPGKVYQKRISLYQEYSYKGNPETVHLSPGTYSMACWGAQGGPSCNGGKDIGGKGGYAYGEIVLDGGVTFYLNVGAKGNRGSGGTGGPGGWNGGGKGGNGSSGWDGGGGGGASDIRLAAGNFYSRLIVAGGGGGGRSSWGRGGTGGGISGTKGIMEGGAFATVGNGGNGFGTGGAGGAQVGSGSGAGGGGGGYYGGEGGYGGGGGAGGEGGSGFVSGMSGCDAIAGDGDLTQTGQPNHYSRLVFQNAAMQNDVNAGHGKIQIKRLR